MPRTRSPFVDLLADLNRVCDDLRLGWYLFGAQAALLYGSARLTADVDVTVSLGQLPPEDFARRLGSAGFRMRFPDPQFLRTTRVMPVLHLASGVPADIVIAGPGLEEAFLERATRRDIGGLEVPVARAEDIIVMKVLAARGKDREDIAAIVAAQGDSLDVESVRATLAMLEEALGQSDLLPLFDQALTARRT
jgi:hypothetical protein